MSDYQSCMMELFADKTKFTKFNVDPTLTQLTTLQNYLRTIYNRGEITNDVYSEVQSQSTQPARAHGLPKIHKDFDILVPRPYWLPAFAISSGRNRMQKQFDWSFKYDGMWLFECEVSD